MFLCKNLIYETSVQDFDASDSEIANSVLFVVKENK